MAMIPADTGHYQDESKQIALLAASTDSIAHRQITHVQAGETV
jgi:hypothetical protein